MSPVHCVGARRRPALHRALPRQHDEPPVLPSARAAEHGLQGDLPSPGLAHAVLQRAPRDRHLPGDDGFAS